MNPTIWASLSYCIFDYIVHQLTLLLAHDRCLMNFKYYIVTYLLFYVLCKFVFFCLNRFQSSRGKTGLQMFKKLLSVFWSEPCIANEPVKKVFICFFAWEVRLNMFSLILSHDSFSICHYKKSNLDFFKFLSLEIFPFFSLSVLPPVDCFLFHSYQSCFLADFFQDGMDRTFCGCFPWVMTLDYFRCFTSLPEVFHIPATIQTVLLPSPTLVWLSPPCLSCLPTCGAFTSVFPKWICIRR